MGEQDAKPWLRLRVWIHGELFKYLSPVARSVLTVLVKYTNRDGVAYPSAETLARESGYWRAKVYRALKEIVGLGLYRKGEQVTWTHAGGAAQYYYYMQDLDSAALGKILEKRAPWKTGHRAPPPETRRKRRDISKTGTPEEPSPGDPKTGTPETVRGVPKMEPRGVSKMEVSGDPKTGTQRGKGKRVRRGKALLSDSVSLLKSKSPEKNRAKDQARLVRHFEAEQLNGRKLKPLAHWLKYLHPEFTLEDIEAVFKQMQKPEG